MIRLLRPWRIAILAFVAVVFLSAAVLLAGGWHLSGVIFAEVLQCDWLDPPADVVVEDIGEGRITLRATALTGADSDMKRNGIYGLESVLGYDQVGSILEPGDEYVVREFNPLTSTTRVGVMARLDHFAFPGDPQEAHRLDFQDVFVHTPRGKYPAWSIEGSSDTWVIIVHGRRVGRREALRVLPTVHSLELSALVITYRNDFWSPKTDDCLYRYGQTEWEDLEGAVRHAVDGGADQIILFGYSYGGAIIMNFLYESTLREKVAGVILDAPMLDLNAIIDRTARERNIPKPFLVSGKTIAAFRFDIDWNTLNYLSRADELSVPILLFHGDADDIVPIGTSEALEKARPELVTFVKVDDASHARAWNAGPDSYEARVRAFLQELMQ